MGVRAASGTLTRSSKEGVAPVADRSRIAQVGSRGPLNDVQETCSYYTDLVPFLSTNHPIQMKRKHRSDRSKTGSLD